MQGAGFTAGTTTIEGGPLLIALSRTLRITHFDGLGFSIVKSISPLQPLWSITRLWTIFIWFRGPQAPHHTFGLFYHSAGIIRGIDLGTVLKYPDPY